MSGTNFTCKIKGQTENLLGNMSEKFRNTLDRYAFLHFSAQYHASVFTESETESNYCTSLSGKGNWFSFVEEYQEESEIPI